MQQNTECFLKLGNAIVMQAVDDYKHDLKELIKKPGDAVLLTDIVKIEKFFRSEWYKCLTDVDPEKLIKELNGNGVNEPCQRSRTMSEG